MNVEEFMKKNNIAILVEVDLKNKKMDIKKTDIELESPDLFKQLIDYGSVESLIECTAGQLLPRIWAQGNTKCIISKASEEKIIVLFYDWYSDAKGDYYHAEQLDKQLCEMF